MNKPRNIHGFWYVVQGNLAYLVTAWNREASSTKFKMMYPGLVPLYSAPGIICNECNRYRPPLDRDVQLLTFPDAEPCKCTSHETQHFLGEMHDTVIITASTN
jgi:hypothetical protein